MGEPFHLPSRIDAAAISLAVSQRRRVFWDGRPLARLMISANRVGIGNLEIPMDIKARDPDCDASNYKPTHSSASHFRSNPALMSEQHGSKSLPIHLDQSTGTFHIASSLNRRSRQGQKRQLQNPHYGTRLNNNERNYRQFIHIICVADNYFTLYKY